MAGHRGLLGLRPKATASSGGVQRPAAAAHADISTASDHTVHRWANRHVDAGVLVLYNAVQPPLTALLLLAVPPADQARYGWRELLGSALVMGAVALSALDARRGRRLAERPGRDS